MAGMARPLATIPTCFSIIIICLSLITMRIEAAPQGSLVTQLPGFNGTFPSSHYSGYVSIGAKNLFYYFVVSEGSPADDPVVLWLNGGPGCSSFDGFVYEHGPFNFEQKSKGALPTLQPNPYSWSKVSNMLYLDSPAGVGFSYSEDPSQYVTGDLQTAADTHAFLLSWFKQYPEFLSNPFYISGESYAGVYVPTLAFQVATGIQNGTKPVVNLKGYMVGNGVTDRNFDNNALVPFAHGMALISDQIYEGVIEECGINYSNSSSAKCNEKLHLVSEALGGLNIYNVLEPCYHNPGTESGNDTSTTTKSSNLPFSFQQLGKSPEKPLGVRKRMFGRAWPYQMSVEDGLVPLWPQLAAKSNSRSVPCFNDEVATKWLNDPAVREAIHAKPASVSGPWELCSDRISYYHDAGSMIPYHRNLTTKGYKAIIFSGDHDMCVPYTGSQAWTSSLGYKVIDQWRSWLSNDQVAGYLQAYENDLTFLTVKGAGHTVPEYKPREALDFYSRWLAGKPM
ncbi:serine carboxypeptidase-like 20 [Rosa rugosa]|uniref:serine carboxypeptidase-like 20 n=1 Tax=Rosa rugosa TaxID=74645 RepID=UPI002B40D61A|nr:serine carboxypeptidase-like 20 [Rosa rugosa]